MIALLTRELIVAARRPAAMVSACAVAALLTAFVAAWSPGIPVIAPMNLYDQTRLLHWLLLSVALPWIAVRSVPAERGDAIVLVAALTGQRPGDVLLGKILAMFVLLALVVLTGLPALVVAQQAAAVPLATVLGDIFPLLGAALLVAVTSVAAIVIVPDRLAAWLSATAVALVMLLGPVRSVSGLEAVGLVSALTGVVSAAGLYSWTMRALCYLRNPHVAPE